MCVTKNKTCVVHNDQSWNRSTFLTGLVKNRQKNQSLIILDLTGEKPVRCMYQFTNQFFRETVCHFSSTETYNIELI